MPLRRGWTEAEDATIRDAVKNNLPTAALAERFGVSISFMRRKIGRLGLKPAGWRSRYPPVPAPPLPPAIAALPESRQQAWWPLPPGHPETWGAITRGTVLEGQEYPRR